MNNYKLCPQGRMLKEEHIETIITLYNEGLSLPKIAEKLNMKRFQPIAQFLDFNGIRTIDNRDIYFDNRRISDKLDKSLILKLINEKKTRKEMAVICNTTESNIKRFLKRNNIRIVKFETINYRNNLIQHKEDIINFYEKCKRLQKVSEKYQCTPNALRDFFRSINYNYKKNNNTDLTNHLEDIKNFYYNEDKNLTEIGNIYNCSYIKIRDFLIQNKCSIRDKTELLKERNKLESFQRKCLSGSGKNKEYLLPSGTIIKLRGYEPNFLDFIFSEKHLEETEIVYKPERIRYEFNDKEHFYYPDFYIPKYNLIVETKSSWIMKKQGIEKTLQKEKYTTDQGFQFLLIIDNNFEKVKDILSK